MKLPEYDPDPDLWSRIEADLNADARIDQHLSRLPVHEPVADLWDRIESELAETRVVPLGSRRIGWRSVRPWVAVAASVLIVAVSWWFVSEPSATADEQVTVAYSVEAQPETAGEPEESKADQRAEAFIERQCAEQQLVCQRPEVHELRNQLAQLKTEQLRIEQEMSQFGDDPALVRAQVKVENQRAEIAKELITLLRS